MSEGFMRAVEADFGIDPAKEPPLPAEHRPRIAQCQGEALRRALDLRRMYERAGNPEHARLARAWRDWARLDAYEMARADA